MRRAGHEEIQTSMGYVKLAEDLTGELGAPFAALPQSMCTAPSGPMIGPDLSQVLDILAESKGFETGGEYAARVD